MEYVLLIIGFVLLIKGADFFVDGSSAIARLFKVPPIVIGLTIVAFGTSLPEAAVSISAAIAGENSIAISNVLGSNIFNLLVVLGASALILPVAAKSATIKTEIPLTIGATVLLGTLLLFNTAATPENGDLGFFKGLFADGTTFTLSRIGGVILLVCFAAYLGLQIMSTLRARRNGELDEEDDGGKKIPLWLALIYIVGGAVGIIFGGDLVVDSATIIAESFGMSPTLIGLTIVAVGTSLPELVTSIVAAKKGESDIALGNVVGSNMFNIVFILGMSAAVSPITVDVLSIIDTVVLVAVSLVCWWFTATKKKVSRVEGAIMLAMYIAYSAYIIIR